jgi:tRNA-modifying protein YgfZ
MGAREIEALERGGRVFADLSSWWKFLITGADATGWLNDLATNRVDDLHLYESRRTLLLSRTGHVRADFHVLGTRDGLLLVQDPVQPRPVRELLEPYMLSSDVMFEDRTKELALMAHRRGFGRVLTVECWKPSVLGSGMDRLVRSDMLAAWRSSLQGWLEATAADLEVWRIRRGVPRFGVDVGEDALAAEAGWDGLVDQAKGCFLGQEAVAKVRNLGHPPRVIVLLRSDGPPLPGEPVLANGEEAGRITGAAPDGDGYAVLARVRWEARDGNLATRSGKRLASDR